MRSIRISFGLVISIALILIFSSTIPADALDDWKDGDEKKYTGHTFDEEFWVADHSNTTEEGYNLTSSIFYMNSHNVQAFLVAINKIENDTNIGTYPYQLFGLHYYSPKGQEVFIGAVFAFLMGYNNTYNPEQGVPDPGEEKVFFIIPFGAGSLVDNNYVPTTERMVERIDDTHYIFEISYKNLYAIVTENPYLSAVFKTGWIAKFSELTFRYEITLDLENGEVKAETFYDIGQVTELWAFILGIPVQVDVTQIPDTFGIAAVHYVATFTSYSRVVGAGSGNVIDTGISKPLHENLTMELKDQERVFEIGFRGTYDVFDETQTHPALITPDQKAVNILIKARPLDKLLIQKQLLLSADLISIMAYGTSDTIQKNYDSPHDLKQKAIFNFHKQNFWYAVAFPQWGGYRIEHDPTYTAYTSFLVGEPIPIDEEESIRVCGSTMVIIMACTASICVIGIRKKR